MQTQYLTNEININTVREQHNNEELKQEYVNEYLGVNKSNGIQHATIKEMIRKESYQIVRLL